jgi:hypothetical protein
LPVLVSGVACRIFFKQTPVQVVSFVGSVYDDIGFGVCTGVIFGINQQKKLAKKMRRFLKIFFTNLPHLAPKL